MAKVKYYSPRIDRDLVSRLYHEARIQKVPMTVLASRILRAGLVFAAKIKGGKSRVAEEPPDD
jgi:hypothetical protein